jgi:hypothetical protein
MKPVAVGHRRFGAEVKMTDASNSGVQVASADETGWSYPSLIRRGDEDDQCVQFT